MTDPLFCTLVTEPTKCIVDGTNECADHHQTLHTPSALGVEQSTSFWGQSGVLLGPIGGIVISLIFWIFALRLAKPPTTRNRPPRCRGMATNASPLPPLTYRQCVPSLVRRGEPISMSSGLNRNWRQRGRFCPIATSLRQKKI